MTRYKGGGATVVEGGDADIVWTETPRYGDKLAPNPKLPDALVTRDTHRETTALQSAPRFTSARVVPAVTAAYPEQIKARDSLRGTLTDLVSGRSGSPDTDIQVDGWVDGVPLNNTDNHGNENPLPVSGDTLLATEKSAYMYWNLTSPKFVNLAARPGGTMRVSIWLQQALAVAQTLTISLSKKTAQPFTESTLNWNNKPTVGTNEVTRSISVLVGAENGRYDIDLTEAEYTPFMGAYLLLYAHSAALLATPINIQSREATAAERPRITFDFQR